ncbi:effector-associated domain EAD1-containing protein [Scytonema sp. PCC 10023]|uniref:effector-associated domain EAD1-containing protein n=1 Tax=Scytonema sp. PCC 10023 TaxID=1680591 RepID=UPI0039C66128
MPEISNTQEQPESEEFDVFLAHNSADKPEVRTIAHQLKTRNIKIWFDEEQIPPGRSFQDEIQKAIPLVKSAAIFIGLQGLGKWQEMEVRSLTTRCVEKGIPLIPILLPGVTKLPEKLVFLKEYTWVDFSKSIDDVQALKKLVWGITGTQSSPQQKPTELWFNGERLQQFQKALLNAFPTPGKLKQMVRFRLDENLDAIAAGANLSEVVSNLIEWAEAEGKLEELLIAARKENPGNPALRKFDEQIRNS